VNRLLALSVAFCFSFCLLSQAQKALAQSNSAAVFTILHTFCVEKGCVVGESSQLVQGLDGNLYGATQSGGNVNKTVCPSGCGTIYKITPAGALSIVYAFCSLANCADGISPASLLLASDGNFYGVTEWGGIPDANCPPGCGTIFKLTPQGILTTLYYFDPDDTFSPRQLIQGADGNFYGWAYQSYFEDFNVELFEMTPQGNVSTTLGFSNDYFMLSFQAPDGVIYGTTDPVGDEHDILYGGTVFAMTSLGALTTIHDFCPDLSNCANGYDPTSLFRATDGDFYGSMYLGGNLNNTVCGNGVGCGLIFKLSPGGAATTLYTFCPGADCWDGFPISLMQASDGNFYGLTSPPFYSTSTGTGTIFELAQSGAFTTLFKFCGQRSCKDGAFPNSSLLQATNGMFYGTTNGGDNAFGTIFSLSLGLSPFVKTLPTSGEVGKPVYILGTKLTGATEVTFNGVAANFNVVSPTEITTTVPKGATSGIVTVTTQAGALSSNVNFLIP
jgi:uncharacterized repeat protein (TIGR03803 family)